ncbi:hypothetical protein QTI66_28560 [Variovorax sp. J22R133]|uniref:hypothetical protein n=1 Tax=Variovorax brevis TaxID=3053503 RepID=UPI002577A8D9|nr:hypothetical protein [Variovorax sp. J22R133]MDM0116127.1 hypothetical protein [Variovorax sp. J22R133]
MTASRDPAMVVGAEAIGGARFTSDDGDKIRDYVNYGSSLPVILQAVEVFVGYKRAGVAGLEPVDLQGLFGQICQNCDAWEPARDMISRQTATLMSISDSVVPSGEALIKAIQAMPLCERIRATVGTDLINLPPLQIPDEPLGAADAQAKSPLAAQLASLRETNRGQADDTEEAMRLVESFRGGVQVLEPVVAGKRVAIKNSSLEKVGNEVTVEPTIAALQREYDRAVQASGPGTAIAVAKRAELDAAIQTLKSQMDVYRGRQRVTYTMGRLFVHFTELGLVMLDAETALGHLWLAWREAGTALENAGERFESIDSSRKLLGFLSDFQTVINNWKLVQNRAAELHGIF